MIPPLHARSPLVKFTIQLQTSSLHKPIRGDVFVSDNKEWSKPTIQVLILQGSDVLTLLSSQDFTSKNSKKAKGKKKKKSKYA